MNDTFTVISSSMVRNEIIWLLQSYMNWFAEVESTHVERLNAVRRVNALAQQLQDHVDD